MTNSGQRMTRLFCNPTLKVILRVCIQTCQELCLFIEGNLLDLLFNQIKPPTDAAVNLVLKTQRKCMNMHDKLQSNDINLNNEAVMHKILLVSQKHHLS